MVLEVRMMSYFCICWKSGIHEVWIISKAFLHFGHLLDVYLWLPIAWELLDFCFYI